MNTANESAGTLTLMGSGEMTTNMVQAHRHIMSRIAGTVKPVFIDTPANFEPNVDAIAQRARDYFETHFGLPLETISYPTAVYPTPVDVENAMRKLRQANYIFAGPGSPTYAVRAWRKTSVFETMAGKLASGSHMVLASAAVTAMGRYTLPVYEIYKVGLDLYWAEGLDLLGRYGLNLAVIPHWNNSSGETHDTSRCFMGEARMQKLEAMLPRETIILGIDESTACIMELGNQEVSVLGQGGVTVRTLDGRPDRFFASDERFSFDLLRLNGQGRAAPADGLAADDPAVTLQAHADEVVQRFRQALLHEKNPASAVGMLHALVEAVQRAGQAGWNQAVCEGIEVTIRELLALLAIWLEEESGRGLASAAFVGRLVDLRQRLRSDRAWESADQLRAILADQNVVIEDSREGSTWHWGD